MTREIKELIVTNLTDEFKSAKAIIVCDYKGMKVEQLESIRNIARESGTKIRIVKNTLSKIALKNAEMEDVELVNTNLLVWGEDQISACKVADKAGADYEDNFIIKTALIEGKVVDLGIIAAMAKLPSRDELIGMLLSVWTAPARNMVTGLDNLKVKLEESA